MLVSFIPFFLVARVAINDGEWKYGPEYVFRVGVNTTLSPMNHDGVQRSNYTTLDLFCRPKGSHALLCRLRNARRSSMDLTNNNELDIPEEEMRGLYSEEPFEIKFNERGVEQLIVNEHIRVADLNDIRNVVGLFNIGADLNGVPDGIFQILENTVIGQCNVTVALRHVPTKNGSERPRYQLESLPQLNKVPEEHLVIRKVTNLNNCSYYAPFYFGSYGHDIVVEPSLSSHLESSHSRTIVTDYIYESVLVRAGTFGSDKMNNLVAMTEYISVLLWNIVAAENELIEVSDPSKTTITANSDLDRIFPMK